MKEEWKDVEGFEGLYQVSNLGRVKSLFYRNQWGTFKREHILKQNRGRGDYLLVPIYKDGKRYSKCVHRLVAEAFCEKRDGCDVVNHIDYNRTNNRSTNLEWCTTIENVRHSLIHKYGKNKIKTTPTVANKTGELGVYRRDGKYCVIVCRKWHGLYSTIEEAVAVRDVALKAELEAI